ncbi:hypothetical protein CU098_007259 [Rhizopus stolonifer]|uniref:START domain-containing protein n=1 Tax=Rhizopus stolonifer TaxID=4846 RepID=A0A367KQA6_RHIST|nr:hypothetical protein CU098_007259 [Rhizopus stolonifer]
MTRSFAFSQDDLAQEWEEAYNKTNLLKRQNKPQYNAIFSDDEEEPVPVSLTSRWFHNGQDNTGYVDPVISSSTYHIHQADNALLTLKHIILEDGWKKALKHKSGVMVHMKSGIHKDKIPVFKGEAIIQGFSPQSIFYVIGMRKLWDEQYEDGKLVENLNDTTSLTYEVMKSTSSSKCRDLALVEKIECTPNGVIMFACTSVETPRIPRFSGRVRVNIKLQGWILEPLPSSSSHPVTKVTFVIQESMKGWVPGFAKKSLARRPLVIAKVAEYLERKSERIRAQQQQQQQQHIQSGHSRRPSAMYPTRQASILMPPSSLTIAPKKHISFADRDKTYTSTYIPENSIDNSSTATLESPIPYKKPSTPPSSKGHLYPSHRHSLQKIESLQLLKKLTLSTNHWKQSKQFEDNTCYTLNSDLLDKQGRGSFMRVDAIISGGWTAEQLCSVVHCFGSRKVWDATFEDGKIMERFSQKDYLVHWILSNDTLPIASVDLAAITSIETDPVSGTVYTATCSVIDKDIPPDDNLIRASSDLYGWVFQPVFDTQGKTSKVKVSFVYHLDFKYNVPVPVLQKWTDMSMQSIQHVHHYLTQYGCPPYIRRVAGKVVQETFDAARNCYKVILVTKHQPSNAYRARKKTFEQQQQLWCTDIRFHKTMFPHGLDIHVEPMDMTRIQVSTKEQKSLKLFTTDEAIDGKQVTLTLMPLLLEHEHQDAHTYRYNNQLFLNKPNIKQKEQQKETKQEQTPSLSSPPLLPSQPQQEKKEKGKRYVNI